MNLRLARVLGAALLTASISCGSPVDSLRTETSPNATPLPTFSISTPTPTPATEISPSPTPTAIGGVIAIGDNFFQPPTITIQQDETVTWQWGGAEGASTADTHNVVADDASFASGPLSSTGTFSFTFTTTGTFRYHCEHHGGPEGAGMSGVVVVE